MKLKRIIALLTVVVLTFTLFTACGNEEDNNATTLGGETQNGNNTNANKTIAVVAEGGKKRCGRCG